MEPHKVIFFKLCFLFSIGFAFCIIDNDTYNENRKFVEDVLNAIIIQYNDSSDDDNKRNKTAEETEADRREMIYITPDFKCVLPEEAHRVVHIMEWYKKTGAKRVWGSVVNFTDHINERLIEVDQFLGIPYAIPPQLYDERFAPPRKVRHWWGWVHTHKRRKGCAQQTSARVPWAEDYDDKPNLNEDCLYLNIWTPLNQTNQGTINEKPVLFWIHGGFFLSGSTRQEIYDGRVIAGLGDVVVVTMDYRLGAFGFWTSGTESAPGNVALLDIYRALVWCRRYINSFGGDAERMTLAGQGAGAVAAGLLSLGHGYARPWYRLILQSGSPLNPITADPQEALTHSYNIAVGVGCANESYRLDDHPEEIETCMRSVDPLVLMEEEAKIRLRPGPYSSFVPSWGSSRFPYNPYCDFLEGNYDIQEILIGTNHFDGAFQIAASDPLRFGYFFENDGAIIDVDESKRIFRQMFPYVNSSDVDEVFRIYNASDEFRNTENATWIPKLQLARAVTDLSVTCASLFFAEKASAKGVKVYYYDFTFKPETSPWPQWMRPTHFEEIQYVFGRPYLHPDKYSPGEIELSRNMIEMWTNFTKMVPTWPLYTNARPPLNNCFIQNPKGQAIEPVPRRKQCDIFRKYFGRSV